MAVIYVLGVATGEEVPVLPAADHRLTGPAAHVPPAPWASAWSVFQKSGQGSYLQFIAPGVVGMAILFTSIFSGIGLLWDRQFGFLKETLVAPVPRLQIMAGAHAWRRDGRLHPGHAGACRLPDRRLPPAWAGRRAAGTAVHGPEGPGAAGSRGCREALETFDAALERTPGQPMGYVGRWAVHFEEDQFDEAWRTASMLRFDADHALGYLLRAWCATARATRSKRCTTANEPPS